MEKLLLAITSFQYQDILFFLESQEQFQLSKRFLKFRPNLIDYKGHTKDW